jgi:hypothetical protein
MSVEIKEVDISEMVPFIDLEKHIAESLLGYRFLYVTHYLNEKSDDENISEIKKNILNSFKDNNCNVKIEEQELDWIEKVLGKKDKSCMEFNITIQPILTKEKIEITFKVKDGI